MEGMLEINDVKELAKIIENFGGLDVVALDIKDVCNWTDYFIIATFTSLRQMEALYEEKIYPYLISKNLKIDFIKKTAFNNDWTLIDTNNVLIHLMNEKSRKYYDLESLWEEGTIIY